MAAERDDGNEILRERLSDLAKEISSDLAGLEGGAGKELLSDFVSELFLLHAEECRQAQRRRKQAEGIAAAKARGVRFGRPGSALPERFDAAHTAWREGRMPLGRAAESCGMTKSAFYNAVLRREQSEPKAV